MESHNGTVTAESTLGVGTTITTIWPLPVTTV
jgi:signal transduction histidine kinase